MIFIDYFKQNEEWNANFLGQLGTTQKPALFSKGFYNHDLSTNHTLVIKNYTKLVTSLYNPPYHPHFGPLTFIFLLEKTFMSKAVHINQEDQS